MRSYPFVSLVLALSLSTHVVANDDQDASVDEFVSRALDPIWRTRRIREPLFFIQPGAETRPTARLLFQPEQVISVTSATRTTNYEAGRDYVFDAAGKSLSLPAGSRIPFVTHDQLYPLMTSDAPKIRRQRGDMTRGIFFDNKAGYHELQVEVTYRPVPDQWKGDVPPFAGNTLPRTIAKLRNKQPLRVLLSGDSISEGYNASKFTGARPGCPAYGELVALALEKRFGSRVSFSNHAVGGWNSGRGLKQAIDEQLGEQKPDVVIIAFGMNDVFARDAAAYQQNVRGIMQAIRQDSPDTEFLLVASMLGNDQWGMPMEQFPLYRDALEELCGAGVALADLTTVWKELLKHKSFYDLTGNGVNHPNDFGHIVYAQTILSRFVETQDEKQRVNTK